MIDLRNVTYTYPFQDAPAVSDISLAVEPGELVLCTGASGSGKSTLVRLVNGLCPHYFQGDLKGGVAVNGRNNASRNLHAISQDVGTLFQDPELQFFALNVEDELAFAHEWRGREPEAIREDIHRAAEKFGVAKLLGSSIQDISEGEKQRVALASILSLEPKALILDEPSANLDPEATRDLAEVLVELKNRGMAILVVDHRLYWLKDAADKVVVMDKGRVAETGDFSILYDSGLRSRYGLRKAEVDDPRLALPSPNGERSVLGVKGLSFGYKNCPPLFENIGFTLSGAVTGVIGDNGVGKTTLARLLTGLTSMREGEIYLDDRHTTGKKLLRNASLVQQNADHQLYMTSVRREMEVAARAGASGGRHEHIDRLLEEFNLSALAKRHPQSLSGGEKQRLTIACGLVKDPRVVILDEPTSGLDGRNMECIASAVRRASEQDACVLLISHDLEMLGRVCDFALRLPIQKQANKETHHVS